MCGVFGSIGAVPEQVSRALDATAHRGPDARGQIEVGNVVLGHVRLSILDLDRRSDQPFRAGDVAISFNGEIWNHAEVRRELEALGRVFRTTGDTEVLAHALDEWDEAALPRLQGMFAVAWTRGGEVLKAARDRFGEVPLHGTLSRPFCVASEVRALVAAGALPEHVFWVPPGHVARASGVASGRPAEVVPWYSPPVVPARLARREAAVRLRAALRAGVAERAISDASVCCLLSGGLDSAAVLKFLNEARPGTVAYTAVMNRKSPDLRAAREVAEALGSELREVEVPLPTGSDLAGVVRAIEMPHKAQVEIGWACLHLARRMRADGFKVTYSGEGSDELWASYGFAYHALKTQGWHEYRRDLFLTQHRKNFARCNKVFMAHSIECRLPFLNTGLVELALSLPRDAVQDGARRPKAVLQEAMEGLLPDSVVRRTKLAFQDGLGLKDAVADSVSDARALYVCAFKKAFPGLAP